MSTSAIRANIEIAVDWFVINYSRFSAWSWCFWSITRKVSCAIHTLELFVLRLSCLVYINLWVNFMRDSHRSIIKKLLWRSIIVNSNVVFTRLLIDWEIGILLFDLCSVPCCIWFLSWKLSWFSWCNQTWFLFRLHISIYWFWIFIWTSKFLNIVFTNIRCIESSPNFLSCFQILFVLWILRWKDNFITT